MDECRNLLTRHDTIQPISVKQYEGIVYVVDTTVRDIYCIHDQRSLRAITDEQDSARLPLVAGEDPTLFSARFGQYVEAASCELDEEMAE